MAEEHKSSELQDIKAIVFRVLTGDKELLGIQLVFNAYLSRGQLRVLNSLKKKKLRVCEQLMLCEGLLECLKRVLRLKKKIYNIHLMLVLFDWLTQKSHMCTQVFV